MFESGRAWTHTGEMLHNSFAWRLRRQHCLACCHSNLVQEQGTRTHKEHYITGITCMMIEWMSERSINHARKERVHPWVRWNGSFIELAWMFLGIQCYQKCCLLTYTCAWARERAWNGGLSLLSHGRWGLKPARDMTQHFSLKSLCLNCKIRRILYEFYRLCCL